MLGTKETFHVFFSAEGAHQENGERQGNKKNVELHAESERQ